MAAIKKQQQQQQVVAAARQRPGTADANADGDPGVDGDLARALRESLSGSELSGSEKEQAEFERALAASLQQDRPPSYTQMESQAPNGSTGGNSGGGSAAYKRNRTSPFPSSLPATHGKRPATAPDDRGSLGEIETEMLHRFVEHVTGDADTSELTDILSEAESVGCYGLQNKVRVHYMRPPLAASTHVRSN